MKLTEAQATALAALPATIIMWGGKPLSGMPKGIKTRSTLFALSTRGLACIAIGGVMEVWDITEAGRKALEESKG